MIELVENVGDNRKFALTAWTKAGMSAIDSAVGIEALPAPVRTQDYLEKRTVVGRSFYFLLQDAALDRAKAWLDRVIGQGNYTVKSFAEVAK